MILAILKKNKNMIRIRVFCGAEVCGGEGGRERNVWLFKLLLITDSKTVVLFFFLAFVRNVIQFSPQFLTSSLGFRCALPTPK